MIKESIAQIVAGNHLSEAEATAVMSEIMAGEATESQIAAFITALRMKGETVDEITGCARVMRTFATPIRVKSTLDIDREDITADRETILDTCGTGGDGTNTFNVSTATALVAAACGMTVAKHGNRSVSSACGSADVLEALGVNVSVTPEKVEECLTKIGIGFLFAPLLHGSMKYAAGPRRQIGIRTIFNLLGPLTNPANANCQVLGVYDTNLVEPLAQVLNKLGIRRAWVVHGADGMDEISISGETAVAELSNGAVTRFTITPEKYALKRARISDIKGGTASDNAAIIRSIIAGEKSARRDIVVLNAAAGLYVGSRAESVEEGVSMAAAALDSGAVKKKLDQLVELTNI
ncbi:MAG: anthranilate phosphoribosyltransferase [Elusimicrobia bacterium]|nr:anthranilate phosphoribosyltransferase [Elusimicrobiota bacterium]